MSQRYTKRRGPLRILLMILVALSLVGSLAAASSAGAYERPGVTQLVTVDELGLAAASDVNQFAPFPSLDGSGRHVAFAHAGVGLVTEDVNPGIDFFVRDLKKQRTEMVSVRSDGSPSTSPVITSTYDMARPALSGSGRFVAFVSRSPDLVPGDTNVCADLTTASPSAGSCPDIFVHDRHKKITERVSVASDGVGGNNASYTPSISMNGRHVAFMSLSDNLVPGDNNNAADVFIHDRTLDKTVRVSLSDKGSEARFASTCPSIDPTGRYLAFVSGSPLDGDYPASHDEVSQTRVFLRDLKREDTELVSLTSADEVTPVQLIGCPEFRARAPSVAVSAGGRFVAFQGDGFVPNEGNGNLSGDVYVRDRLEGRTERISVTSSGEEAIGASLASSGLGGMDYSGRYLTFFSSMSNLFPGDDETQLLIQGDFDVFMHDRDTGSTRMISINAWGRDGTCPDRKTGDGGEEVGVSNDPALSGNGRTAAFNSCNADMVERNESRRLLEGAYQVFARDTGPMLGVGGFKAPSEQEPPDKLCLAPDVCIPPQRSMSWPAEGDADEALNKIGAKLHGASLAYRPELGDLFAVIELEHLPEVAPGISPIIHGLRFVAGDRSYEVRSTPLLGGTFGLFDCTDPTPTCTSVADLIGGYGTTGMRIVFSLPLADIGLQDGGWLSNAEVFSGFGTGLTGASTNLDRVRLK